MLADYPSKRYPSKWHGGKVGAAHRVRAELVLGHPLPPGAEVHHADGSKRPDAPLVICQDKKYHQLLHVRARVLKAGGNPNTDRLCGNCGPRPIGEFMARPYKVGGVDSLCRPCRYAYTKRREVDVVKPRHYRQHTEADLAALGSALPHREVAELIGRSVSAVKQARIRLRRMAA